MPTAKQLLRKTSLMLCFALTAFFFAWNFHLYECMLCVESFAPINLLINLVVVFLIVTLFQYSHPAIRPVPTTLILFASCFVFVLLFHFWHCNRPWEPIDAQISFIEVIIGVLSLLIVIWGGYTAVKQLQIAAAASRETAQSNKLAAFQCMIGILQKDIARERRARIYALFDDQTRRLKEPDPEKWSAEARRDVHDTLADFDQIGLMVRYGLLDYEFLEGWDYTIYKILHIARALQEAEEKKYAHRSPSGAEPQSNYYLGLAELRSRKTHEFDFEHPAEAAQEKR